MVNQVDTSELETSKGHIIVNIMDYVPKSVLSKTIIRKITGNVTVSLFDIGEEVAEKSSPFDTFIQVIDGAAEVKIDKIIFKLGLGEGIVIPANSTHCFHAYEQFKMISTMIKSGDEN